MFADNPFAKAELERRPDWRKELIEIMQISEPQRSKIFKFKRKF